jgi:hypothetical protein
MLINEGDITIMNRWYDIATTYFMKNSNDMDFGVEIGFIEDQCDIYKEFRFGLDEYYHAYNEEK